jgi:Flp pilus assembly pilin Flp
MNNLKPIDLKDPRIKSVSSLGALKRRIVIGLLVAMIAMAMIAWLGFLGWGLFEILRPVIPYVTKLWSTLF